MNNPKIIPADSVRIKYNEARKDMKLEQHSHNFYQIIYIKEGLIEFKINGKKYTAGKNSLIFISNLESHELKVLEYPYKRYYVLIKPHYLHSLISEPVLVSIFKHRPAHFNHVIALRPEDSVYVSNTFKSMYDEASTSMPFWEFTLCSYFFLLLTFLFRKYKDSFPITTINKPMETILDVQKYIEQHFTENIVLEEVSKRFYSNKFYMSHLFKKITGFSFKEYLILQRILKSKELLINSSESITHVGLYSGFNNVNHFIRIFRQYEGITPYQYRKKHAAYQ
ncbi:MAG: Bifunctional transcriptional activator/DNA repair enzyme AdaA [Firmicutes bacterium ADurb.Bin193]|nr:MAG: Bifunctional transcriptional activator/DNA repair enzyme AdaA [Firmicutes bacterium ADurb.Bin193]